MIDAGEILAIPLIAHEDRLARLEVEDRRGRREVRARLAEREVPRRLAEREAKCVDGLVGRRDVGGLRESGPTPSSSQPIVTKWASCRSGVTPTAAPVSRPEPGSDQHHLPVLALVGDDRLVHVVDDDVDVARNADQQHDHDDGREQPPPPHDGVGGDRERGQDHRGHEMQVTAPLLEARVTGATEPGNAEQARRRRRAGPPEWPPGGGARDVAADATRRRARRAAVPRARCRRRGSGPWRRRSRRRSGARTSRP